MDHLIYRMASRLALGILVVSSLFLIAKRAAADSCSGSMQQVPSEVCDYYQIDVNFKQNVCDGQTPSNCYGEFFCNSAGASAGGASAGDGCSYQTGLGCVGGASGSFSFTTGINTKSIPPIPITLYISGGFCASHTVGGNMPGISLHPMYSDSVKCEQNTCDPEKSCNCPKTPQSANLASGEVTQGPTTDFVLQGTYEKIEFKRYYYSQWANSIPLGYGWTHSFNSSLQQQNYGMTATVVMPSGISKVFHKAGGGNIFYSNNGDSSHLYGSVLVDTDGKIYHYSHYTYDPDNFYHLSEIDYPSGQVVKIDYEYVAGSAYHYRVQKVYDNVSRRGAVFSYDDDGEITHIAIGDQYLDYTYSTDGAHNLWKVTANGDSSPVYRYAYNGYGVSYPHSLLASYDANGNEIEAITHDGNNRALDVVTAEHDYLIQYDDTLGGSTIEDLNTGIYSHSTYDTITRRLLTSNQCIGSCSSTGPTSYLYDGYNNRIVSQNDTMITQSFYDMNSSLKGKIILSSLDWGSGDLTDNFNTPDVNGLNWRVTPGQYGVWQMVGDTLEMKSQGADQLLFSSRDRIILKGNFTVGLKFHIPKEAENSLFLTIADKDTPDYNWVKLTVAYGTTGFYSSNYSYYDSQSHTLNAPANDHVFTTTRSSEYGELILARDGDTVRLYAKDAQNGTTVQLTDTPYPGTFTNFTNDMIIEFGTTKTSNISIVGVGEIDVIGSQVEHYEATPVANQPVENYTYYTASNTYGNQVLLTSVNKPSLYDSSTLTKTIYDYDTDYYAVPNQHIGTSLYKHVSYLIRRGFVANNLSGSLNTGETIYTCYKYYGYGYFPDKLTKEYQPSTQHGCTSPYIEYKYYLTGAADHSTGDLEYVLQKSAVGSVMTTTTYLSYDNMGNPTSVSDPNGVVTDYVYDLLGHITSKTIHGASDYTTEYGYTGDILKKVVNPSGTAIKYSYNTSGDPRLTAMGRYPSSSSNDPLESMSYEYGNSVFTSGYTGASWTRTFYKNDSGDTVLKVYQQDGTTFYQSNKRKFSKTTNGSTGTGTNQSQVTTLTIFDDNGSPMVKTVDDGQTTLYSYNTLGQLASMTVAGANTVTYAYDIHGNLNLVTLANGSTTGYSYDDLGRLIRSRNPDSGTTYYQYDIRNNLIAKKDGRNITTTYSYDSLNRLKQITYPNDSPVIYHYDGEGFYPYPSGTYIQPSTDNAMGRLSAVQVGNTINASHPYPTYTTYDYDARGNVIHTKNGIHGHSPWEIQSDLDYNYTYDNDGNMVTTTVADRTLHFDPQDNDPDRVGSIWGNLNSGDQNLATNIAYYPFGPVKSLTYGNGILHSNSVDKRYFPAQIKDVTPAPGNTVRVDLSYTAGPRGNIASITDAVHGGRSESFGYDVKDQIISASGAYGTFAWTYDTLGNRTVQTISGSTETHYLYGSGANRLTRYYDMQSGTSVEHKIISYDSAGSMSELDSYDGSNNLLDSLTVTNNDDSRLAYTVSDGSSVREYYNHLGQRIMRISQSELTLYVYDLAGNLAAELDSSGNPINMYVYLGNERLVMVNGYIQGTLCSIGQATRTARDNWAVMVIVPITVLLVYRLRRKKKAAVTVALIGAGVITFIISRQARSTLTYGENVYYYHNDHLGTPKLMTDASRVVAWDAIYEPFGTITDKPTETVVNNLRFPGQYEDQGTGMYYNWNRYYIPDIGRYNRVDPIISGISDLYDVINLVDSLITYGYVKNNSINLFDENGLCECSKLHSAATTICVILRERRRKTMNMPPTTGYVKVKTKCPDGNPVTIGLPQNDCFCTYTHEIVHRRACRRGEYTFNNLTDREWRNNKEIEGYQAQLNCIKDKMHRQQCCENEIKDWTISCQ